MKKEKKKEVVEYNPTVLLKNIVIYQLIILYFTLVLGDLVSTFTELGNLVTRYMPIGIVTMISTFFILKTNVSKCLISDKEEVKSKIIIAPLIVAIILFGYGLYSVESNMSSIRNDMRYSYYSIYMSTTDMQSQLSQAASEARINWLITSIVYFVTAECAVFLLKERFGDWLKEESVYEKEKVLDTTNTISRESVQENESHEETQLNNIKWDL